MKVVIIGTGHVATVFGKKILEAGHEIKQVVGRNLEQAHLLASAVKAAVVYNTRYINMYADIYIISVADKAIEKIAKTLRMQDKIVVHTGAAVPMNILEGASANYGILYPLQSLRKDNPTLPDIPVLINGNNDYTKQMLLDFANDWAASARVTSDDERLKLHTAAVIVNNFTNLLYASAKSFCQAEHLEFKLLQPLIEETALRLNVVSPEDAQTGPAVRGDFDTIEKHKLILSGNPALLETYTFLTDKITSFYGKK